HGLHGDAVGIRARTNEGERGDRTVDEGDPRAAPRGDQPRQPEPASELDRVGASAGHGGGEDARSAPQVRPVRWLRRVSGAAGREERAAIDVALEVVHLPERHALAADRDARQSGVESADLSIVTHLLWCYARARVDTGWEEPMEEMVARCAPDRNRR